MPSDAHLKVDLLDNGDIRILIPKSQGSNYTTLVNSQQISTNQAITLWADLKAAVKLQALQSLEFNDD